MERGLCRSHYHPCEVVFGSDGQWLTLRHDTSNPSRSCPACCWSRAPSRRGETLDLDAFL